MNQGKLEVVKQEMARVNIDILGINGWEWANLTQMTIVSTTVGKNPLEEMSSHPFSFNSRLISFYSVSSQYLKNN